MRTKIFYTRYADNRSKTISVIFLSFLEAPRTILGSTAEVILICTRVVLVHPQEMKNIYQLAFSPFPASATRSELRSTQGIALVCTRFVQVCP
jgi:hypothetical protein